MFLDVTSGIRIPRSELNFSAVRAAGPGGQHVNKTSSAVELRFDAGTSSAFTAEQRRRVLSHADRRINRRGVIVLKAQDYRSQVKNREVAEQRLAELLEAALKTQKARIKTKLSQAQRKKRADQKLKRSQVKQLRKPPSE